MTLKRSGVESVGWVQFAQAEVYALRRGWAAFL